MDGSYDFKTTTISNIFITGSTALSATTEPFIGAVFHNLDDTDTIYVGKNDVATDGTNGFGIEKNEMITWRAEGDLKDIYVIAGGGSALRLTYVIWK